MPEVTATQLAVMFAKWLDGYRPGADGWTGEDAAALAFWTEVSGHDTPT